MLSLMDLKSRKVSVKKKKFYDKDEMDEYLEFIFDNYKELYDENQELKQNAKTLSDGIQYYRSIETTMQKALVLAEKTAKETKDAAQLKAEAMEKDAAHKAEQIVTKAEEEYERIKDKCLHLVQQFNQYKLQLQQVATAQLEMINSDKFDVYAPEIEAIREERQVLPDYEENPSYKDSQVNTNSATQEPSFEFSYPENERVESSVISEAGEQENELEKTMVIPDVKKGRDKAKKMPSLEDDLDVLTADTIDLSDTLNEIQKPLEAKPQTVQDAMVLEPVDAVVTEPMDLEPIQVESKSHEVLEPIEENSKNTPTLDSLLQSINIGSGKRNKKKKGGQDEDPFEFLGSVDDF